VAPPSYGHAAIKGRSYRTNATHHLEAKRVATLDIRKFYPSTKKSLVRNFFHDQLLCAPDVSDLLAEICCFTQRQGGHVLSGLPTGSPLSPILSLYVNKPMFDRLNSYGINKNLVFTCYIDDLTFSGPTLPRDLVIEVKKIVFSFGHSVALEKTKIYSESQAKHITGVTLVNNELKVPHSRFKKARAIEQRIRSIPTSDTAERLVLHRKLAGLLGEAAFLDARYRSWAQRSYSDLRAALQAAK